MTEKYQYEIGGKTYTQAPLVLGQLQQLMKLLEGVVFPGELTTLRLIEAVGSKMSRAIAIVLKEENVPLKDKEIDSLTTQIESELSLELAIQVIEDFFDCNPIPFLLERLGKMAEKINQSLTEKKTGLTNSSVSLQEGTSQNGTQSSGNAP